MALTPPSLTCPPHLVDTPLSGDHTWRIDKKTLNQEKSASQKSAENFAPALTEAKIFTLSLANFSLDVSDEPLQLVVNVPLKRPNSAACSS